MLVFDTHQPGWLHLCCICLKAAPEYVMFETEMKELSQVGVVHLVVSL